MGAAGLAPRHSCSPPQKPGPLRPGHALVRVVLGRGRGGLRGGHAICYDQPKPASPALLPPPVRCSINPCPVTPVPPTLHGAGWHRLLLCQIVSTPNSDHAAESLPIGSVQRAAQAHAASSVGGQLRVRTARQRFADLSVSKCSCCHDEALVSWKFGH